MEVKKNRLTLLKKLNVTKSGLVKTLAGIFCIAAFTYLCYFVISNRLNSTGDTQGQNKNVYVNKGTAYEGKDINKEDPEAVNMYCQDLREMRTDVLQGEQAFDDICVMDSIAREWIPTASEEHLQYLIDDHPECFSQEYNNMGYHCFTGFDKSGCNSDNVDEQGNQCTPLNAKEKKQVGGFDASNFLANNQAQLCSLVANCDVTTNDVENKPQDLPYGEPLNDAFYNKHQCHVDGFNLQGEICDLNKIPRKFDSNTGLDQFELNLEGYNASLCNLKGLNSKGKRCDLADIPRIYRNNKDQFGLYPNGKNEFNCDLKGRKPNGDLCSLESIPKIYDDENKDQFGVYLNGENENGCNLNHRKSDGTLCKLSERTQIFGNDSFDQQNLDVKGFNPQGCSLEGINRVGERCDLKDIPRVYEGEPPRDQFNLSPEGFSITTGCNLKGFKIDGSKCTHEETPKIYSGEPPRDQFNINKSGFNEFNCGLDGKKPDGTVCAPDQLTHWFDPNSGVDQFQLNEKGYSVSTGCNLSGYNTDGNRCEYDDIPKIYGEDNFNQLLLDKDARNKSGCGLNGKYQNGQICIEEDIVKQYGSDNFDVFHKDPNGLSRLALDDSLFNEANCNVDGLDRNGEICDLSDIPLLINPITGADQFGVLPSGFNEFGCSLAGVDESGKQCPLENIPFIYSKDGVNQLGLTAQEVADSLMVKQLKPLLGEGGEQLFLGDEPISINEFGEVVGSDGQPLLGEDGQPLTFDNESGEIINATGKPVNLNLADGSVGKLKFIGVKPLETRSGEQLFVDGKSAFSRPDGLVVDADGNPLLSDEGEALFLDKVTGQLTTKSGKNYLAELQDGEKQAVAPINMKELVGKGGQPLYINGKKAYRREDGVIVDEKGNLITDSDGSALTITKGKLTKLSGKATNAIASLRSGNPYTSEILTSEDGQLFNEKNLVRLNENGDVVDIDGLPVFDSALASTKLKPLKSKQGEQLFIDGKRAYIKSDGSLVDKDGQPLLSESGEPLTYDPMTGQITTQSGKSYLPKTVAGIPTTAAPDDRQPILAANGEQLYVNGQQAFRKSDGSLVDKDGQPLLSEKGETLTYDPMTGQITTRNGQPYLAKTSTGVPTAALPEGIKALLTASGEQLYVNGQQTFRKPDGSLVDKNGLPLLSESGEKLFYDPVTGALNTQRGRTYLARTATGIPTSAISDVVKPLLTASGEQLYVNGQQAFRKPDGSLVDKNGQPLLSENGEALTYDPMTGQITTQSGKSYLPKTAAGIPTLAAVDDIKPLLAANGEPLYVNGQQAFRKPDGSLVDKNGQPLLSEKGEALTYDPMTGQLTTQSGKSYLPKTVAGILTSATPDDRQPLLATNGEPLYVNGQQAFRKSDGSLVDKDGHPLLSEKGEALTYDPMTGQITTRNGQPYLAKTSTGVPTAALPEGIKPLLTASGEQLYVNGQQAFRKPDGSLVDKNGLPLLSEKGEALTYDPMTGQITTRNGQSYLAKTSTGVPTAASPDDVKPLLATNGEPLYVNGQQAFRKPDGSLVDKNGLPLLSEKGEALTYDPMTGQITTRNGQPYLAKTSTGVPTAALPEGIKPLLTASGEQLYVNGQQAFRKPDGSLVDKNGLPLLSEKGEALTYDPMTGQITTRNGQSYLAKTSTGVPTAASPDDVKPLLATNGEPLYVNGQQAFRKPDGSLVDKNGQPLLSENGEALTYDPMTGQITTRNGQPYLAKTSTGVPTAASADDGKPLLAATGEPLYVNGQQAFRKPDGSLVDKNGLPLLSENGEKLIYDPVTGQITTQNGESYLPKTISGVLTSAAPDGITPLFSDVGEKLYVNGVQAFRKADGSLVNNLGENLLSDENEKIYFNPLTGELTTQNGNPYLAKTISGAPKRASLTNNEPLLTNNGKALYIDGKQAYRRPDGTIIDAYGNPLLSPEGKKLHYDSVTGNLLDESGDLYLAQTQNGQKRKASSTEKKALTGEKGEILLINGKKAYQKDGVLVNADGDVITDKNGNPLTLTNGKVTKLDGSNADVKITNLDGELYRGLVIPLSDSKTNSLIPLLSDSGETHLTRSGVYVYLNRDAQVVNSKAEIALDVSGLNYVFEEGQLKDFDGSYSVKAKPTPIHLLYSTKAQALNFNGNSIFETADKQLLSSGSVLKDLKGNKYSLNTFGQLIDGQGRVRNKLASNNEIAGYGAYAGGLWLLTTSNNDAVFYNGKKLQVDASGRVRDELGDVVLGNGNKPLYFSSNIGVLRGEMGDPSSGLHTQKHQPVLNKNLIAGSLSYIMKVPKLISTMLDVESLYASKDGLVSDSVGNRVKGQNGNSVHYYNGLLLDDGIVIAKGLYLTRQKNPLKSNDGRGLYINGKQAFLSDNGLIVDSEGNELFDEDGSKLKYKDGSIVDENNKAIMLSDEFGGKIYEVSSNKPLRGLNGEAAYINGQKAYVNDLGHVVNSNGDPILGPDGKVLTFDGESVRDSQNRDVGLNTAWGGKIDRVTSQRTLTNEQGKEFEIIDGYNSFDCNVKGFKRDGSACSWDEITKIYDPKTGLDQFDHSKDGYNLNGCNYKNRNRSGKICDEKLITKRPILDNSNKESGGFKNIIDSTGVNPVGKRSDGLGRLGLDDEGYNEHSCNIEGLNRDGEICPFDKIPLFFNSETGKSQFGTYKNGFNDAMCNLSGRKPDGSLCDLKDVPRIYGDDMRDQFGLDPRNYNSLGCNDRGFREDGSRCEFKDITKRISENGLDQFNLLKGRNEFGCDVEGFKADGTKCSYSEIPKIRDSKTNLDQFNLDPSGVADGKCSINGIDIQGNVCDYSDIPKFFSGEPPADQFGFGEDSYNKYGCDFYGYKKDGSLCKASEITRVVSPTTGLDQFGIGANGKNAAGCDINNINKFGKECAPRNQIRFASKDKKDKFGFVNGVNEHGCDIDGLNSDGEICEFEKITKIRTVGNKDHLGYDLDTGLNENNCDFNGRKPDGTLCKLIDMTRIFDAQRKDQNGLPESGFNDAGCNLLGYTAEGEKCDITDSPRIFDEANFDQFGFNKKLTDKDGYNPAGYDENNCDRNYQDPDGNVCQRFKSRELTIEDGAYIATRKEQMDNFLKNNEVIFTTLKAAAPATGINSNIASNTKQIENIPNTSEVISQVEVTPAPNSSSLPESRFGKAAFNGLNPESGEGETPQIPLGLTVSVEIDTPVNSDYTKEVYGVIRGSELDGAVVKGAIEVPYIDDVVMPRDKFRYVFNTVIYKRKTYTIDAVSYNPFDDSGMVTASNVDYHRIQRFGGILGATLIQALDATFLDSVEEKNLQQQAEILDGTGSVAITYGDNTTRLAKNNAKIITNNINDIALKQFFRRPTITKGKSMQFIIFRKEVLNPELPMVLNDARGLHDFN